MDYTPTRRQTVLYSVYTHIRLPRYVKQFILGCHQRSGQTGRFLKTYMKLHIVFVLVLL